MPEREFADFTEDMQRTIVDVSFNSFENGLRIGLSLLQCLLTAELPEIHVIKHESNRTERRCPPIEKM